MLDRNADHRNRSSELGLSSRLGTRLSALIVGVLLIMGVVQGCADSSAEGLEQAEQQLDHSGPPTYQETKEYLCQTAEFRDDPSC